MLDSIGAPLEIGDWVAFYKKGTGKTMFGQVVNFNQTTMSIKGEGKSGMVCKNSAQVVKVSPDLMQVQPTIVLDSTGAQIGVGDWVAMTSVNNSRYSSSRSQFQGSMVFGEIKKLGKTIIEVRIANKDRTLKKLPKQVVKISPEQMTLKYFSL